MNKFLITRYLKDLKNEKTFIEYSLQTLKTKQNKIHPTILAEDTLSAKLHILNTKIQFLEKYLNS